MVRTKGRQGDYKREVRILYEGGNKYIKQIDSNSFFNLPECASTSLSAPQHYQS